MSNEKYSIKSEIEHVLDRSGVWLGSTEFDRVLTHAFKPSEGLMVQTEITTNDGLIKLIDEILSNSIDEFRRPDALFKIKNIWINVNSNGLIEINDDGGISCEIHKQTGLKIPKLIFGQLRSSSNYDDTKQREVVGTNGLGAKLTNIFSKTFEILTADGKEEYGCTWCNNMREILSETNKKSNKNFTKISFQIDLERFKIKEIPLGIIRLLHKRCIDGAAANLGLTIHFTTNVGEGKLNSVWKFNSFEEYIHLFLTNDNKKILEQIPTKLVKKEKIYIVPNSLGYNIGFVNGALCSEGTHIKKIQKQICEAMLQICHKNDMELITEKDILNRMSLFINCIIINPKYDSQAKDKLATKIEKGTLEIDEKFLKNLKNSELFQSLKDFYDVKYAEVKRKETRKLNSTLKATKIKKLISCLSKMGANNELWIFEGNSASNGFKSNRAHHQAAYLLRGKITNTFNLEKTQIVENIELREIIAALGVLFNEGVKNLKTLKYQKIIIATDMDYDGHHICGLLLAFLVKHFPELVKHNKVFRALSPIVIAKKGKETKYYYTQSEYEKDSKNLKGYEILYNKGLGGLSTSDYKEMLRNQRLVQFTIEDTKDIEAISIWFDKSTEQRKEILAE